MHDLAPERVGQGRTAEGRAQVPGRRLPEARSEARSEASSSEAEAKNHRVFGFLVGGEGHPQSESVVTNLASGMSFKD